MDKHQFDAILPIIVADLVIKIAHKFQIPEDAAISELYGSNLYALLENEDTKVWQYSSEKMLDLYSQEKDTDHLDLPDY